MGDDLWKKLTRISENIGAMSRQLKDISRLYLDANVIIYFLEENTDFWNKVEQVFQECEANNIQLLTSDITVCECLMRPYKDGNYALIALYEQFFQSTSKTVNIAPVETSILLETPKIASDTKLKTIDAIHLATAEFYSCDALLTNDKAFRSSEMVQIFQLSQFSG